MSVRTATMLLPSSLKSWLSWRPSQGLLKKSFSGLSSVSMHMSSQETSTMYRPLTLSLNRVMLLCRSLALRGVHFGSFFGAWCSTISGESSSGWPKNSNRWVHLHYVSMNTEIFLRLMLLIVVLQFSCRGNYTWILSCLGELYKSSELSLSWFISLSGVGLHPRASTLLLSRNELLRRPISLLIQSVSSRTWVARM